MKVTFFFTPTKVGFQHPNIGYVRKFKLLSRIAVCTLQEWHNSEEMKDALILNIDYWKKTKVGRLLETLERFED